MQSENEQSKTNKEEEQLKWLQEIRVSEKAQAYLSNYKPESVAKFLEDYVQRKSDWYRYGANEIEKVEGKFTQWIDGAYRRLPNILQKKLFDVQCLWRAEQMEIPEIKLSVEFKEWQDNIFNCPFVEPLNEDDIAMYQEFLLKAPLDIDIDDEWDWQDMQKIRAAHKDEQEHGNVPEWYEFCFVRQGSALMLLPDIRGEKEEFYLNLGRKERQRKWELENPKSDKTVDKRPNLYIYSSDLDNFARHYEDKQTLKMYSGYKNLTNRHSRREDIDWELSILEEAEENVPIEANKNWKKALKNAAISYYRKMIAAALPEAWSRYRLNIDLGIGFPEKEDKSRWLFDMYSELILEGRVLNGEPNNLDF